MSALAGELTSTQARARYAALHAQHLGGYDRLNRVQRWYRWLPEFALKRLATKALGRPHSDGREISFRSTRYLDVLRAEHLPTLP